MPYLSLFQCLAMTDFNLLNTTSTCNTDQQIDNEVASFLIDNCIKDGNIIGYFENMQVFSQLTAALQNNGYSYSIRDSTIRKSKNFPYRCLIECVTKTTFFIGEDKNNTIFYHLKAMPIKFFGLPFTVEKTVHYQCIYGHKYYKTKAERLSSNGGRVATKRKNVASKKIGCVATMTVKKITCYPKYYLEDRNKWRKKKMLIENLRGDLSENRAEVEQIVRYYVSVSVKDRHNHPPLEPTTRPKSQTIKSVRSSSPDEPLSSHIADLESNCCEDIGPNEDIQFLHSLVKFPSNSQTCWESNKSETLNVASTSSNKSENEDVASYQIALQYPSLQDLQTLFKEKLKRLYILGENCENPSLLVKLVTEFERADLELIADIGYDPTV